MREKKAKQGKPSRSNTKPYIKNIWSKVSTQDPPKKPLLPSTEYMLLPNATESERARPMLVLATYVSEEVGME